MSLETSRLFDVKGKVVLVTGGSRGIGKMIAAGFVENGAKVYITARSVSDCENTARELNAKGPGRCISLPADMQKVSAVQALVKELSSRESVLHVLVNNAGATWGVGIEEYPDSAFTKLLTLNVQRVFTLTQMLLPLLRKAASRNDNGVDDPARIINIGSVDGIKVPPLETYAYSASKAALHQMSRHFAGRLGTEGITSNVLACGPFQSKMMAETLRRTGDVIRSRNPLGRIGTTDDVAGACLFLASRAGAYVNGATITLDGGETCRMDGFDGWSPSSKL